MVNQRESKDTYRRELENQLRENNMKHVWSGMKKITGLKEKGNQAEGNYFLTEFPKESQTPPCPPLFLSSSPSSSFRPIDQSSCLHYNQHKSFTTMKDCHHTLPWRHHDEFDPSILACPAEREVPGSWDAGGIIQSLLDYWLLDRQTDRQTGLPDVW